MRWYCMRCYSMCTVPALCPLCMRATLVLHPYFARASTVRVQHPEKHQCRTGGPHTVHNQYSAHVVRLQYQCRTSEIPRESTNIVPVQYGRGTSEVLVPCQSWVSIAAAQCQPSTSVVRVKHHHRTILKCHCGSNAVRAQSLLQYQYSATPCEARSRAAPSRSEIPHSPSSGLRRPPPPIDPRAPDRKPTPGIAL